MLTNTYLGKYSPACHAIFGPFHRRDLKWALTNEKPTPLRQVLIFQKRNGFAVVVNQGLFLRTCIFCANTAMKIHQTNTTLLASILFPVLRERGHIHYDKPRPQRRRAFPNRAKARYDHRFFQYQAKPSSKSVKDGTSRVCQSHYSANEAERG